MYYLVSLVGGQEWSESCVLFIRVNISKLLKILRAKGFLKNVFFKVIIEKNIPQGSGLGGGSSDAASVLNILKKKYYLKIYKKKMIDVASQVGSDVPFCIEYFKKIINSSNKKFVRPRINLRFFLLLVYPNFKNSTRKTGIKIHTFFKRIFNAVWSE